MPKGNNKKKAFYFLMQSVSGDLQTFKIMAKSRRFAEASAKVAAGPGSEIAECCKKGEYAPNAKHPKLREFMGYSS